MAPREQARPRKHRTLDIVSARVTWRRHPGVRSPQELTVGERAADRMRNGMGSWGFVIGSLVFLTGDLHRDVTAILERLDSSPN